MDKNNKITEQIIGASYVVSNELGVGFLEKGYENALSLELRKQGLFVEQQKSMNVYYSGVIVGEYYADLLVEHSVIVELKVVKKLINNHQAQLMNYLKAGNMRLGLLINFASPRIEIKRMVNGF